MSDSWFKRKRYGWGWTPATWQGWSTIVALVVAITVAGMLLGDDPSPGALALYLGVVALAVLVMVLISTAKGPAPRWRWGGSPGDDSDEDA